jgi:hypothetical protein
MVVANDRVAAQDGRVGIDDHVVFQGGMAFHIPNNVAGGVAWETQRTQGHALVQLDISANIAGFADLHAGAATNYSLSIKSNGKSAGTLTVTVTALDASYNNIARGYLGVVQFISSDGKALLPTNYAFTPADQGTHVFAVTFKTPGHQTLIVTDTKKSALRGQLLVPVVLDPKTGLPVLGVSQRFPAFPSH